MTIIDLSIEIIDNLPVFPGDKDLRLTQTHYFDKDKYSNFNLNTGMHVGTHIDAPMHMTEKNVFVSDIGLGNLIG